jgi:hypothetical protein
MYRHLVRACLSCSYMLLDSNRSQRLDAALTLLVSFLLSLPPARTPSRATPPSRMRTSIILSLLFIMLILSWAALVLIALTPVYTDAHMLEASSAPYSPRVEATPALLTSHDAHIGIDAAESNHDAEHVSAPLPSAAESEHAAPIDAASLGLRCRHATDARIEVKPMHQRFWTAYVQQVSNESGGCAQKCEQW